MKSLALHHFLFDYELPDTLMVLTETTLHMLCGKTKAGLLAPCRAAVEAEAGVALEVTVKPKGEDGAAQMRAILEALPGDDAGPLGVPAKDKHDGAFFELWGRLVEEQGLATVDAGPGIAQLLAPKDAEEQVHVRKAANLSAQTMAKFFVPELEDIVDGEKRVKHHNFATRIEDAILDPKKVGLSLIQEKVDFCYSPIVQSGGEYNLKASAQSNERNMKFDVVTCALGARYANYCSNIVRTYLFEPTKEKEAKYAALLRAREAALGALRPGARLKDVYRAAADALQAAEEGLAARLTRSIGFVTGLEFRESTMVINAKNETEVRAGMVFNLNVGLGDLADSTSADAPAYALQVADTVLVGDGGAEVLTAEASTGWKEVSYFFKDDEENVEPRGRRGGQEKVILEDKLRADEAQNRRNQRQQELLQQTHEETLARLTAQNEKLGKKKDKKDPESYKSTKGIPIPNKNAQIRIDQRRETVILPIFGYSVPFHISTIKNIANNQDGQTSYVRINFLVPGKHFGKDLAPQLAKHAGRSFLKEASFKAADSRHAAKIVQEVKTLQRLYKARETEQDNRATLKVQEKLVLTKGRVPRLTDVWCRPNLSAGRGRKHAGYLEAHTNGFRYQNQKGDHVDVIFKNIKHAFFQPAEDEMVCLMHFHLHSEIMAGKKKTRDIQFYTEVMDVVQTLDAGRRSMYDPDELEEEQRERDRRNRTNGNYQAFTKQVSQVWERDFRNLDLEFDIPFRELGFTGVPNKTSALLIPTVNCLVELVEQPPFIITLADIEVVNLERVGFGLKNFDMAVVFKSMDDVHRIDAIPVDKLDQVKEWLTSMNIKYYESKMNLVWKPILKTILDDPQEFIENGGWEFLNLEASDSEEDGEESEGFEPDSEESEESEDDESDESDFADEDESDEGDEESDLEEEGKDWDELEAEALESDKKRERGDDDEGAARKKKPQKRRR